VSGFFPSLGIYTAVIAAAILVGGMLPTLRDWHRERLGTILSLGAGIMLGSAFFHLLPDAYDTLGRSSGVWVLLGFLFLYFIEKFITVHICEVFDCEVHHLGVAAFVGIAIHSLTNGIALGSGIMTPGLGFVVFLAISAHKTPEAFSLTSVLLHSGVKKSMILLVHLVTLSMIPLGALMAYVLIPSADPLTIAKAIAFSAGTFIHISLSDLLPEVHKLSSDKLLNFFAFVAGLALMWLLENRFGTH
jgi:Predicted divalent heavy-metal cations transporter